MEGNKMVPNQQSPSNRRTRNGSNRSTRNGSNKRTRNDAEGDTLQTPSTEPKRAPRIRIKPSGSQESASTRINNVVLDTVQEQLLEGESSEILEVPNTVQEILSSNEVLGDEHPILLKLNPPSRSDHFITEEKYSNLLQECSKVLIEDVENSQDANRMVDLASKTFACLDSFSVDYLALYEGVYSFIRGQCDKEALHQRKPHPAFITKVEHEQIMSGFSDIKETKSRGDKKLQDAKADDTSDTFKYHRAEEKLKKRKETMLKTKERATAALADQVVYDKVYSEYEVKVKNIAPKMAKAQVVIDDWERRWNEANDRMNRAKDELSRLKK